MCVQRVRACGMCRQMDTHQQTQDLRSVSDTLSRRRRVQTGTVQRADVRMWQSRVHLVHRVVNHILKCCLFFATSFFSKLVYCVLRCEYVSRGVSAVVDSVPAHCAHRERVVLVANRKLSRGVCGQDTDVRRSVDGRTT